MNDIFSLSRDPVCLSEDEPWRNIKFYGSYVILLDSTRVSVLDLGIIDSDAKQQNFEIADLLYSSAHISGKTVFLLTSEGELIQFQPGLNEYSFIDCPYVDKFFFKVPKGCFGSYESHYTFIKAILSNSNDCIVIITHEFEMIFGIYPFTTENWKLVKLLQSDDKPLSSILDPLICDIFVTFPTPQCPVLYIYLTSIDITQSIHLYVFSYDIDSSISSLLIPMHLSQKIFQYKYNSKISSIRISTHPINHTALIAVNSSQYTQLYSYTFYNNNFHHTVLYKSGESESKNDEVIQIEWMLSRSIILTITNSGKLKIYTPSLKPLILIHSNDMNEYIICKDQYTIQLSNNNNNRNNKKDNTIYHYSLYINNSIDYSIDSFQLNNNNNNYSCCNMMNISGRHSQFHCNLLSYTESSSSSYYSPNSPINNNKHVNNNDKHGNSNNNYYRHDNILNSHPSTTNVIQEMNENNQIIYYSNGYYLWYIKCPVFYSEKFNYNTLTPLSYLSNLKQTLQMDIYVKPSLYIQYYNNIKPILNESINIFRLSRELYNSNNEYYSFYLPIIIKYFENILSSLLLIVSSNNTSNSNSNSNSNNNNNCFGIQNDGLSLLHIVHLLHDIELHLSDYNVEEMIYLYNIRILLSLYMFSYNSNNVSLTFQSYQNATNSIRSDSPINHPTTIATATNNNNNNRADTEKKQRSYSIDKSRSNSTGNVASTFRKLSYNSNNNSNSNRRRYSINSNYGSFNNSYNSSNNNNNNINQIQYYSVANQMIPFKLRNINSTSYINSDVDKYFLFLYNPVRDLYFLNKTKNMKYEKSQLTLFQHYKSYTFPSRFDFDLYYHHHSNSNSNNNNNNSFNNNSFELVNIGLLFIEHYRLSELFDLCNYINIKYGNNSSNNNNNSNNSNEEEEERNENDDTNDKREKEKEKEVNHISGRNDKDKSYYFLHYVVADLIVSYLNYAPLYYPSVYSTKKKFIVKELSYEKLKKSASVCSNWNYATAIRFYKLSGREDKAVEILLRNDNEFDIARLYQLLSKESVVENIFPIFKQYLQLHNIRQLQLIASVAETFDISLYLLNKVLKDINHRLLKQIYHLSIIIQDNFVFSKHILLPTLNLHFNKLRYKVPRDVCNHLEFLFCLFDNPNAGLYKLLMLNFLQYFNIDLCNFTTEYDIFSPNCVNEFRKRKKIRYYFISAIVILIQNPELYSLLSYLSKLDEYSEIVTYYKQFLKYLWYFNVRDMFNRYYAVLKNVKDNKLNDFPKIQTPNVSSILCTSVVSNNPLFYHVSPIKPLKIPPSSSSPDKTSNNSNNNNNNSSTSPLIKKADNSTNISSQSAILGDVLKFKITNHMYDESDENSNNNNNNESISLTPIKKDDDQSVSINNIDDNNSISRRSESVDSVELISIVENSPNNKSMFSSSSLSPPPPPPPPSFSPIKQQQQIPPLPPPIYPLTNSNNSSFNYSNNNMSFNINNNTMTDSPSPLKTLHKSVLLDTSLTDDNLSFESTNTVNTTNTPNTPNATLNNTGNSRTTLNISNDNSLFVIDPMIYKYEFVKEVCEWIIRLYYSSYEIFNKNILDYLLTILYECVIVMENEPKYHKVVPFICNTLYHITSKTAVPPKSKIERKYKQILKKLSTELNKSVEEIDKIIKKYNKSKKFKDYQCESDPFYLSFVDIYHVFLNSSPSIDSFVTSESSKTVNFEIKSSFSSTYNNVSKTTGPGKLSPTTAHSHLSMMTPKESENTRRKSLDLLYAADEFGLM